MDKCFFFFEACLGGEMGTRSPTKGWMEFEGFGSSMPIRPLSDQMERFDNSACWWSPPLECYSAEELRRGSIEQQWLY